MKHRLASLKSRCFGWFAAFGPAFWIKWGIIGLVFLAASIAGGGVFFMIALGGALGAVAAIMLDAMQEYRREDGSFDGLSALMTVVAALLAYSALYFPQQWSVVLGCMVSSSILLALLLKRLDPETGMNVQTLFFLVPAILFLGLGFAYTGPYAEWVSPVAFIAATVAVVWYLAVLRDGAETGLRAAWYLGVACMLAITFATICNLAGVVPAPGIGFAGMATGLCANALYIPMKRATGWAASRLREERNYRRID